MVKENETEREDVLHVVPRNSGMGEERSAKSGADEGADKLENSMACVIVAEPESKKL